MTKKARESSKSGGTTFASANWLALRKTLAEGSRKIGADDDRPRKRRKVQAAGPPPPTYHTLVSPESLPASNNAESFHKFKNGESLSMLRMMVFGQFECPESQQVPGKYLALDCEMVGVGIDGAESSLARVSLVNFYGHIQLDEFVGQKEKVVDYRTQVSGIRESDMRKAKPFHEVQMRVAELLKDRILIGHAVHHDLKALLLSHPRPMTRDTQYLAGKHKVVKSKLVALRNLVKQELEITIQAGEHSSITDARAAMAVYRIHRKNWEKGIKPIKKKCKRDRDAHADGAEEPVPKDLGFSGEGRTGGSSGLSTIVKRQSSGKGGFGSEKKWWKELTGGVKGSIKI